MKTTFTKKDIEEAIALAKAEKVPEILAFAYHDIANMYKTIGDYEKALEYGLLAIHIFENKLPYHHADLLITYNNVVVTYKKMQDYESALAIKLKALKIQELRFADKIPFLANTYHTIGLEYQHLKKWEEAVLYGKKAIEVGLKGLPNTEKQLSVFAKTMFSSLTEGITCEGIAKYQEAKDWFFETAKVYWEK